MTPKRIDLDVSDIVKKYIGGMSENALSKLYKANRWTIRQRLLEAGIKIRGRSEAELLKWSQMSPQKRKRQVAAAHKAAKGRKAPIEEKIKRAQAREIKGGFDSGLEEIVFNLLALMNFETIPQKAIGPYSCDLGAEPVAVEIFGGNWHMSGQRGRQRKRAIRYFLDHDWHCYIVVFDERRHPTNPSVTDNIISYVEQIRSNPPAVCEYRMVWSSGEFIAAGCANDDEISFVSPFTNRRNSHTGRYERIPR